MQCSVVRFHDRRSGVWRTDYRFGNIPAAVACGQGWIRGGWLESCSLGRAWLEVNLSTCDFMGGETGPCIRATRMHNGGSIFSALHIILTTLLASAPAQSSHMPSSPRPTPSVSQATSSDSGIYQWAPVQMRAGVPTARNARPRL